MHLLCGCSSWIQCITGSTSKYVRRIHSSRYVPHQAPVWQVELTSSRLGLFVALVDGPPMVAPLLLLNKVAHA